MAVRIRCVLALAFTIFSIGVSAQSFSTSTDRPIKVPLTLSLTQQQTDKAALAVGIGSLPPLSIGFDTGSVGLELYATPGIPGNGTTCSDQTITISYGNPLRVTYSGVICSGPMNLAGVITTPSIPFGLLTALTYCAPGYQCQTPQQNYAAGNYGIFGAGISPGINLPNPLRTLPGAYGKRFMLRLNPDLSQPSFLILSPLWRYDAAIFPQLDQAVGALNLPVYDKGQGCVLVNGQPTTVCPLLSFDTGNGVPFVYVTIPNLPTVDGANGEVFVAPGTTIGLTPRLGGPSAVTLTAGDNFAGEFRYANPKTDLINVGIQAFLGNDVTYDGEQGVITVAPTRPSHE